MKKLAIVLGSVFVVGLTLFGLLAASPNYNYCVANQGVYDTGKTDDDGASLVHGAARNPTSVDLFRLCGGRYASENADSITAISTVVMTVATVLLGWLAYQQSKTTKSQLRAYVFLADMAVDNMALNGVPRFRMKAQNFGGTPAFDVIWTHLYDYYEFPDHGESFAIPDSPIESKTTLGPSAITYKDASHEDLRLDQARWAKLTAGTAAFFVWGRISYRDTFGTKRETTYRYRLGGGEHGRVRLMQYLATEQGNSAT